MLKFCIAYGASFEQLLVKNFLPGHVRSRNYDVTRGTRLGHFLREIAEYGTLEGNIEASFDYFRSELTLLHRHHIL